MTSMWWMVAALVACLALVGSVVWFLIPTFKTVKGPDFEPSAKDEASVERAQMSGPNAGTGAGGGGM